MRFDNSGLHAKSTTIAGVRSNTVAGVQSNTIAGVQPTAEDWLGMALALNEYVERSAPATPDWSHNPWVGTDGRLL